MENAQLWQYLKDNGISQEEAARKIGYTLNYLNSVLKGRAPLNASVKEAFMLAYPETAAFLLPATVVESLTANAKEETCTH